MLPRLSAGRVQSVATRMIVERERARMAFHSAEYWDVQGTFAPSAPKPGDPDTFTATLVSVDDMRLATGRDFDPATGRAPSTVLHLDEAGARGLAARLEGRDFSVQGVEEKPYRRRPYAPFMTSTLQQEAGRKFRWSAQQVMRTAQRLYENGFITYMRTDSTTLSETALGAARAQARELYGDAYVPAEPRIYTRKVKNAQEAHEAIRPAGDSFRTPGEVANQLSSDEFRLYELVWQRTLASQMSDAVGTTVSIRIGGTSASNESVGVHHQRPHDHLPRLPARLRRGHRREPAEKDDAEKRLPQLTRGDALDPREFEADGHSTSPPARYTEPSLVKAMEELGVGRPSTYASIMQTIQDRGYVWKKGPALVPTWTAFAVIGLLESYFGRLVDYGFTASVENDLDDIANGERSRVDWLRRFYFGADDATDAQRISAQGGLKRLIESRLEEIDARGVNSIPLGDTGVLVRVGRYGPYLQRGSDDESQRASVPEDLAPDELTPEKVEELLSAPSGDIALGTTADGREITARSGRYGPYVTDGEKSASLFKTMALDTVTLADAEKLLTLPRTLGQLDGEEVTAQNGRYGPYIKKGTDSRSIENEEQLFTITLDEAAAILAQPKQRGRRAAAAPPLKELGNGPGVGQADGGQGRPVRPVRHRRRDERVAAARRLDRGAHRRARLGAARRPPRARPGEEDRRRRRRRSRRQEGREEDREEGRRPRRLERPRLRRLVDVALEERVAELVLRVVGVDELAERRQLRVVRARVGAEHLAPVRTRVERLERRLDAATTASATSSSSSTQVKCRAIVSRPWHGLSQRSSAATVRISQTCKTPCRSTARSAISAAGAVLAGKQVLASAARRRCSA